VKGRVYESRIGRKHTRDLKLEEGARNA